MQNLNVTAGAGHEAHRELEAAVAAAIPVCPICGEAVTFNGHAEELLGEGFALHRRTECRGVFAILTFAKGFDEKVWGEDAQLIRGFHLGDGRTAEFLVVADWHLAINFPVVRVRELPEGAKSPEELWPTDVVGMDDNLAALPGWRKQIGAFSWVDQELGWVDRKVYGLPGAGAMVTVSNRQDQAHPGITLFGPGKWRVVAPPENVYTTCRGSWVVGAE